LLASRSPLAGSGVFEALKTVTRAFDGLWQNTSGLSSQEVRVQWPLYVAFSVVQSKMEQQH